MLEELNRLLEPIRNRIRLMVARALITATMDEAEGGIKLELNLGFGELRDELELVQQYGLTSRPKPGSQAVTLFLSGSRDAGIVVATKGMGAEMSFRLKEGEVALHTDEGDSVHLKRGRVVTITTATLELLASTAVKIEAPEITATASTSMTLKAPSITLDSPTVTATGAVAVTGAVSAGSMAASGASTMEGGLEVTGTMKADTVEDSAGSLAAHRAVYNSHTHVATSFGSPTSPPTPTDG